MKIENKNILTLKTILLINFQLTNKCYFMYLINEADLCITRAGATSLAEISIMNKPFIAIPFQLQKIIIKWKMQNFTKILVVVGL